MASLISCATGNLTTSTTWALVDSTSLLDSEAANTANTTSYVESATFTPGAITIDSIAVKMAVRVASPTGTASARIAQAGVLVAGTEVTVNVSDMPTCSTTANEGGWFLFKMSAPVTISAATIYTVSIKGSVAAEFTLYRNATAANWSRQLRTTTTQAPVAGDVMHAIGEHTGAGTGNSFVVTMDQTATTDYGPGTDSTPAMTIGKRGRLTYGITGATNYYLKLSGDLIGYNGGQFDMGQSGSEMPRTSTAVLEFDPVLDGGMGFVRRNGFICNRYGLSRTSGKNIVACKLTSNVVATNTSLPVDTDTGWLSGDSIAIAKTTVSSVRADETKILNGDAGANSMSITVALSNTHHGTAPYAGHVVLRTRNVIVRSATSTIMAYEVDGNTTVTNNSWVAFQYMGTTSTKSMQTINTTTGSVTNQYCAFIDNEQWCVAISTGSNNVIFQNNVFANFNSLNPNGQNGIAFGITANATLGANIVFTDNYLIGFGQAGSQAGQETVILNYNTINFSRNVMSSSTNGQALVFNNAISMIGTFDDNVIYGCNGAGGTVFGCIYPKLPLLGGTINRLIGFHNNNSFFTISNNVSNLNLNDCVFFGNSTTNIAFAQGGAAVNCIFTNVQVSSDAIQTSAAGISFASGGSSVKSKFVNSAIGVVTGNYTDNTVEIGVSGGYADLLFDNCTFGGNTVVGTQANLDSSSIIAFNKFQATTNNHQWYTKYGVARSTGAGLVDTTVRTSGSLGIRIAPIESATGFSWSFMVLARANTGIVVSGFAQKNTAFATDVATISLTLPGASVPTSTYTIGSTTGVWENWVVSGNYTGSIPLYATVTITAKSVTAAAYLYIDDIYNGTNSITALDVWTNGLPSPIMFEQLGDAQADALAVWGYSTSSAQFTTAGTAGNKLKSLHNPTLILDNEIII